MKNFKIIMTALLATLFFSCSSNDDTANGENPNPTTDVYIAGNVFDENEIAVYWKNGEMVRLTQEGEPASYAKGIMVVGQDVYVAGGQMNSSLNYRAVVWKNGVATNLNTPTADPAVVNCIFVSGNDTYVGGSLVRGGVSIAAYWKNNEPVVQLSDGLTNAAVRDIFVANGVVHTVGYANSGGVSKAMHWKNNLGSQVTIPTATSGAHGIFVANNNDTYIAFGETTDQQNRKAKYRKNTEFIPLSDGTKSEIAKAITVIDNDIYVAGEHYDSTTGKRAIKYWKNNQPTILHESAELSTTNAMAVLDGKIYIVGFLEVAGNRLPTLWNETQKTSLSTLPGNAEDIFIVRN